MPYLHWETDENRAWTSRTIQLIQNLSVSPSGPTTNQEESLLRGYLPVNEEYTGGGALGGLHIRRTLDQFHHQTVKTDNRDRDQVVLRHCARHKTKEKIFMVDQLWVWIVGDGKYYCQIENNHRMELASNPSKSEEIIRLRRLASSEIFYPEKEIGNLTFLFFTNRG
jgi:hypothetical protein